MGPWEEKKGRKASNKLYINGIYVSTENRWTIPNRKMSKAHEQASLEQIQREKSMLEECPKKVIQEIKN